MKDFLSILKTADSGLNYPEEKQIESFSENNALQEAEKLKDVNKKISYLKSAIEKDSSSNPKTKSYLIDLIKKSDPSYALNIALSLRDKLIIDGNPYYLIATIAFQEGALEAAISNLEVAIWLSKYTNNDVFTKSQKLLTEVTLKISKNKTDNNYSKLDFGKEFDKYALLEDVLYSFGTEFCYRLGITLLETFPKSVKNYATVYKILSTEGSNIYFEQFITYLKNSSISDEIKNLFTGLSYFAMNDFEKSKDRLLLVLKNCSNPLAEIYLGFIFLLQEEKEDFKLLFDKVKFSQDTESLLLLLIGSAYLGLKVDDGIAPLNDDIYSGLSKILEKVVVNKKSDLEFCLLKSFKSLDFDKCLPKLKCCISELYIKLGLLDKAKEMLSNDRSVESHRLHSWIFRIEGNEQSAEEELFKYREEVLKKGLLNDSRLKLRLLNVTYPSMAQKNQDEILDVVKQAYTQIKTMIEQINTETGVTSSTCFEYGCADCCIKTFPMISYTEYLYLKQWLEKQPLELQNRIKEESIAIVKNYSNKYGKELPFICTDLSNYSDTIKTHFKNFTFTCPALASDNSCMVYEARPFMCRAYGYVSEPGLRKVRGCKFFSIQFAISNLLNGVVSLINIAPINTLTSQADKILIGESVIAPIPVWFAQSHEESVWKAKYVRLSKGIFAPVFLWATKQFKKKLNER